MPGGTKASTVVAGCLVCRLASHVPSFTRFPLLPLDRATRRARCAIMPCPTWPPSRCRARRWATRSTCGECTTCFSPEAHLRFIWEGCLVAAHSLSTAQRSPSCSSPHPPRLPMPIRCSGCSLEAGAAALVTWLAAARKMRGLGLVVRDARVNIVLGALGVACARCALHTVWASCGARLCTWTVACHVASCQARVTGALQAKASVLHPPLFTRRPCSAPCQFHVCRAGRRHSQRGCPAG